MIALRKAAALGNRSAGTGSAPALRPARPAEIAARPVRIGVGRFLESVEDDAVRVDSLALIQMMREASGCEPVMWGSSIVGFGSCRYVYDSGREEEFPVIGFSPRKRIIAIYLRGGAGNYAEELARLGKHESGKGCIFLQGLAEVDTRALRAILKKSYRG
jgi:hypothetical protein